MGLGTADDVPLAKARDAAQEARTLVRDGKDPIEDRKTKRAEAKAGASRSITFKAYADGFVEGRAPDSDHLAEFIHG
jgi:hypothetical protein